MSTVSSPETNHESGQHHPLSVEQIAELLKPINPMRVTNDQPDGLSRLKQHDVRRRLTQIFGPTGWGEENLSLRCISSTKDERSGLTVIIYEARVRLHIRDGRGGSLTFFDGVGIFDGTQRPVKRGTLETVVQAHHNVANAACSAAFVRAASSLGDQFGLSFYGEDHDPRHSYVGHSLPYTGLPPVSVPPQAQAPEEENTDEKEGEPSDEYEETYAEESYHDRLEPEQS